MARLANSTRPRAARLSVVAMRGWTRGMLWDETGRPHYETLLDHHLEWVVDEGMLERV